MTDNEFIKFIWGKYLGVNTEEANLLKEAAERISRLEEKSNILDGLLGVITGEYNE